MLKRMEKSNGTLIIRNEKRIKQVSVRLGPTLLARIKKEADTKHMSVAGFIQFSLTDYFEHKDLRDKCNKRRGDK